MGKPLESQTSEFLRYLRVRIWGVIRPESSLVFQDYLTQSVLDFFSLCFSMTSPVVVTICEHFPKNFL